MLQKLREKTTGWIATVILGLLIIPFAFFGMESYMSQRVDTHVARISAPPSWWRSAPDVWPLSTLRTSHDITAQEFRERYEIARMRQRDELGESFDAAAFESADNKRRILDQLIDQRVMRLAAERDGIVVSDIEVRNAIQRLPDFQVDGRFDPERYQLLLASQAPPLTPRQFEQRVRDELQTGLIPAGLAGSAFVTDAELDRVMRLLGETRDVSFVAMPPPSPDTAPVTPAQVQAWYTANAGDFRSPETVRLEYVLVDGAAMPEPVVDEAALRRRYEEQASRYSTPEQRSVAHILVEVAADAGEPARKAAEARARKLVADARAPGADFAALARANSDDAGSKSVGGDLGRVAKGSLPGPLDEAAFAMQAGEVRGPVKSDFGWHVLKVTEVVAGSQQPFESVRAQLEQDLRSTGRERAYSDLTGKLVDAVYKNPNSLEAARGLGLEVRTTPAFPRSGGPGIAAEPRVLRAAFSESLVKDGTASDPIELAPDRSVMIRVLEHTPERTLPLAAVGDAVVAAIRADRQRKAAQAAADALVKAARAKGLAAAAAEATLAVANMDGMQRSSPVPSPRAVEAFFQAPRAQGAQATVQKVDLGDGQYIVFAVRRVQDGDLTRVSPEQRQQLREQLAGVSGESAQQAYVRAARSRYRIEVAEDRL
jgi:peptidyl-prolyl cis-trans isomerase D